MDLSTLTEQATTEELTSKIACEKSQPKENGVAYDENWLKGTSAEICLKKKSANGKKTNFSHPAYKKLSKINGKINDMSNDELVNSLKELKLDTKGTKEVLTKRLKTYYKETNLKNEIGKPDSEDESTHKHNKNLDFIAVIDFEATCTETKIFDYPHEIIEFPVVLVNMQTLTIVDTLDLFCKPVINPKLTKFCTSLTGITQETVDKADEFTQVLKNVESWFAKHELGTKYRFAVATDGPWDMQNFMNLQCAHCSILYPNWAKKWIDVRKIFSNWFGVKRCGIKKMLAYFGNEFEGQQHSGLDDAKNIARIVIQLAQDGCNLSINSHIKKCLSEIEKKQDSFIASSNTNALVDDLESSTESENANSSDEKITKNCLNSCIASKN